MKPIPNRIYYHSSKIYLPSGTTLDLRDRGLYKMSERSRQVEEIFEQIRTLEFPTRLSRLTSLFVAPLPEYTIGLGQTIFKVSIEGETFQASQQTYNDAYYNEKLDEIEKFARKYWNEENSENRPEILVKGKVRIIGELSLEELRAMDVRRFSY